MCIFGCSLLQGNFKIPRVHVIRQSWWAYTCCAWINKFKKKLFLRLCSPSIKWRPNTCIVEDFLILHACFLENITKYNTCGTHRTCHSFFFFYFTRFFLCIFQIISLQILYHVFPTELNSIWFEAYSGCRIHMYCAPKCTKENIVWIYPKSPFRLIVQLREQLFFFL